MTTKCPFCKDTVNQYPAIELLDEHSYKLECYRTAVQQHGEAVANLCLHMDQQCQMYPAAHSEGVYCPVCYALFGRKNREHIALCAHWVELSELSETEHVLISRMGGDGCVSET